MPIAETVALTDFTAILPVLPGLLLAALFAGFVDAVAGGGGLIQVPALLTALPQQSPAMLFGTNKLASVLGTSSAAWRYARRSDIPWRIALPVAVAAAGASFLGAAAVSWLPRAAARPMVFVLLVVVLLYTLLRKEIGMNAPTTRPAPARNLGACCAVGGMIGFYDGFFGPGTGSFLIFAFVRGFGMDFLRASGAAKIVNVGTNLAALAWFIPVGNVLWLLGLAMAVCNVIGAQLGARAAIRRGNHFIRLIFLLSTTLLLGKLGYDLLNEY